jgi:predicted double-glycine peptidase
MEAERERAIHLKVPFYRQNYDFTCGPASLMMAMKYFDKQLRLTKDLEIDVWREGNMIARAQVRYGIFCSYSRFPRKSN